MGAGAGERKGVGTDCRADPLDRGTKRPSVSSANTPLPASLIQKGNICPQNCWVALSPAHLLILGLQTSLTFISVKMGKICNLTCYSHRCFVKSKLYLFLNC